MYYKICFTEQFKRGFNKESQERSDCIPERANMKVVMVQVQVQFQEQTAGVESAPWTILDCHLPYHGSLSQGKSKRYILKD